MSPISPVSECWKTFFLSRSSYVSFDSPVTDFVALRCMFSNISMCFFSGVDSILDMDKSNS